MTKPGSGGSGIPNKSTVRGVWPRGLPRLLGYCMAVGPAATDMYLPAFPTVEAAFGSGTGTAQYTLAAWFAGLAVGQIMQGTLSDRFGRRWPLIGGFVVFAVAMAGGALAQSMATLAVLRFVAALGASSGMVISRAVVRDLTDGQEGAILMSRLVLIMGLAPIVAPSIGAAILMVADWRFIFWFQAAYGVSCALLVWRLLPETLPEERRFVSGFGETLQRYGEILRDPVFRTYAIIASAGSFSLFAWLGGSSPVFIQGFGLSPAGFGLIFGLCACGVIAGSHINSRLLRHFGLFTVIRGISRLALAASLVMLLLALAGVQELWLIVVPLFVVLFCQGFSNGNTAIAALSRHASHAGSAAALLGVFQYLMGAVSGLLIGQLTDGSPRGMALLMCVGALCAVLADFARPER